MADAVALKSAPVAPDFLTQILGQRQTVDTSNSANIAPSMAVFNQMGPMSPAEMDALISSITTTAAQKTPELTAALANATGTRTTGNSPLALALQTNQLNARNQALAAINEQNTQRAQVASKAAGDIAAATKSSKQTQINGGAGGLDPLSMFALQFGINKADKKGWLDWAKDTPADSTTAPNADNAAFNSNVAPGPSELQASQARDATFSGGFEGGTGAVAGDFSGLSDTAFAGSDMPPPAVDTPAPDVGGDAGGAVGGGDWWDSLDLEAWAADGGETAGRGGVNRQNVIDSTVLQADSPGMTAEQALSQIIAERLGGGSGTASAGGYDSGPVPFSAPTKKAAPAPTDPANQSTPQGRSMAQKFLQFLQQSAGFADGGFQQQYPYMDMYTPAQVFANGGRTAPKMYPRGAGYADGGTLGIPHEQVARGHSMRYPHMNVDMLDTGYQGLSHGPSSGFDTFSMPSFAPELSRVVVPYADGGFLSQDSEDFYSGLHRMVIPYADGGTTPAFRRNKNYMGSPGAADTSSVSDTGGGGPTRLGSNAMIESINRDAEVSDRTTPGGGKRKWQYDHGNPDSTKQAGATAANTALGAATFGIYSGVNAAIKAMGGPDGGVMTMDNLQNDGQSVSDTLHSVTDPTASDANPMAVIDPIDTAASSIVSNIADNFSAVGHAFGFADGGTGVPKPSKKKDPERRGELLADGGTPSGGMIRGPGTGTSDSITGISTVPGTPDIRVSNDEYIIPADTVATYGASFFDHLVAASHKPVRR